MQPVTLKMSEALVATAENLSAVVGEHVDASPDKAQRDGCRTVDLMPAGPPWTVRFTRAYDHPSSELIAATLGRLEALSVKGFQLQARKRPDPAPPHEFTYRDAAGYTVGTSEYREGDGTPVFRVTASSPCANED